MTEQYLIRIDSISIGADEPNKFVWTGIKGARWADGTPWVHIPIPSGVMQHQHILSSHVEGEIECQDLQALSTALYKTPIDSELHNAIDYTTNTKYVVGYFVISFVSHTGESIGWTFTNFRVESINVGSFEVGKEANLIVKFSADMATASSMVS